MMLIKLKDLNKEKAKRKRKIVMIKKEKSDSEDPLPKEFSWKKILREAK